MRIQMNRAFAVMALAAASAPGSAFADPPKRLRVVETVAIKAPVDKVWAAVKDFDGLSKWHPAIAKDEIVQGANNQPGAIRALAVKDGPTIKEQLVSFSEKLHSFKYKIVESPLPITNYVSTLSVKEGTKGTTVVRWVGTFKRKNPADSPPEAETDAAGIKLIKGIYQGGLSNLKKVLES